MSKEIENLQSFLLQLEHCDPQTDLPKMVKAALSEHGITDLEITHEFGVSRPTVKRWAAAISQPHPLVRPAAIKGLRRIVARRLRRLANSPEA